MSAAAAGSPGARAPALKAFIVAGEHSGSHLGAGLMRALRARVPDIAFEGVGGREMLDEGLRPCFPLADIAVMGFVPVIARLPRILRRLDDAVASALLFQPDVVVIIDSPDFTHRVARRLRRAAPSIPIVDYVSPTVWAWRPGRARAMRPYVDHLLALLPFEPEAHRALGGPPCTYVGHPLIERLNVLRAAAGEGPSPSEPPMLLVLPGSRRSEIARLTADFGAAVARVAAATPVEVVLPAVHDLAAEIADRVASWPVAPRIVLGEADKFAAFRRARAALAASGTVTLELALAGVPMVVAYKVSRSEFWLRFVVEVPSIVLPNLIVGRNAVPEFLQDACTPEALAGALLPLIRGGPERDAQIGAFADVERRMLFAGEDTPSGRAAGIVLSHARPLRRATFERQA